MQSTGLWKKMAIGAMALLITCGACAGMAWSIAQPTSNEIVASAEESDAGEYTVNITLMQFHSDEQSMGNASMVPEAHIVVQPDGTASLQIDMVSLTYLNREGYLGWLKKVTSILETNKYQYPTKIETLDASVLEEYTDVYDDFNNPDSEYCDAEVSGKWYPKKLSIPIDFAAQEDDILVQVYVPVMESIQEGGGTKFAVLDVDWDSLVKIKDADPTDTTDPVETTTVTTAATAASTQEATTVTTETTTLPTDSKYDKDNLEDGKYELQAEMIKVDRESYSMSNNGINHTVQLEVKDGEYYVTMQFKGLAIYNQFGYLQDLYYYNKGYTYDTYGQPNGTVTKAEVVSTYDVVDEYNSADKLYPQLVKFPLVDKASEEYVPLQVFVPIMEAIADGTGTQNVLMKLDWSTLTKTDGDFQIEEQEEQSDAFDYTDATTGVKVHADQGVLSESATATVTEITSGTDYETASDALTNFKLYSVSVSEDPNGKLQISLPIPSGVTDPVVYRIANGKKTKINGTAADGMYTFSVKETGNFAIGTDSSSGSTTTTAASSKSSSSNSTTKSSTASPKTGDVGAGTAAAVLTATAATFYLARRKK